MNTYTQAVAKAKALVPYHHVVFCPNAVLRHDGWHPAIRLIQNGRMGGSKVGPEVFTHAQDAQLVAKSAALRAMCLLYTRGFVGHCDVR